MEEGEYQVETFADEHGIISITLADKDGDKAVLATLSPFLAGVPGFLDQWMASIQDAFSRGVSKLGFEFRRFEDDDDETSE